MNKVRRLFYTEVNGVKRPNWLGWKVYWLFWKVWNPILQSNCKLRKFFIQYILITEYSKGKRFKSVDDMLVYLTVDMASEDAFNFYNEWKQYHQQRQNVNDNV